ncbi:MAG: peptide transporter [Planctomycetes bacterium]|nr:peptide transporter [Planctomycetota bacterium]
MAKLDKELEQFRAIMDVPSKFEEGFKFSSFLGALFLAMVMVPGALYMELIAGHGIGPAAQWVTVILFIEIAKRANKKLSRAELFILFYISGAIVSQHVHGTPLFTQFLVQSEAAVSNGIANDFPIWVAPGSEVLQDRTFFQMAWLPALSLLAFRMFMSKIDGAILSYGLFKRVSDVERLPFPLAPIGAQGIIALADEQEGSLDNKTPWRWRVFSIGGALGMISSLLYMALPTLSEPLLGSSLKIFPIPFVDLTPYVEGPLPTAVLGITFDFSQLIIGMVMPYWAVFGSFIGVVIMFFMNPVLHWMDVLGNTWQPGQNLVQATFSNNVDFYFSFTIGISVAVAIIGVWSAIRSSSIDVEDGVKKEVVIPEGRGDISNTFVLVFYLISCAIIIAVCGYLIDWHFGVMMVLLFYAFLYTPLISYVTARLEGLAGQVIEIPFIREMSFILSGYKGIEIWFIPIPKANYGAGTVFYKQAELTGTKFTSIWKAEVLVFPIILIATIVFSSFIWGLGEIPGPAYPYTMEIWEFEAKNACLIFSSTLEGYSQFQEALDGWEILTGLGVGLVAFGVLTVFSAPIMLFYGLVKGVSGALVYMIITQMIGAVIGKYYFEPKYGENWKRYIAVLAAGFFCGVGLLSMFCVGIVFLKGAVTSLPF